MKKILIGGSFSIFVLFVLLTMPALAAADKCETIKGGSITDSVGGVIGLGYDQWGYNYQAHMFNGWYDNYSRPNTIESSGDRLMMKWNDAWLSNKDCNDDGKLDRHYSLPNYRGSGAWLTNHTSGTYQKSEAASWNVSGNWLLDFAGGTDNREFRNLVQDSEGNVTGEFWWLNGINWEYGGTLSGNVSGNVLQLHYDRNPILYTGDFQGTVGENSITGGTFTDSKGGSYNWTATGTAVEIDNTCYWSDFVKIVALPESADVDNSDSGLYGEGIAYESEGGAEIGSVIWGEFAIIQEVSDDPCGEFNLVDYRNELRSGLGNW